MESRDLIARARQHVRAGDYGSACVCFDLALGVDPTSAVALGGMGHCLGKLGRSAAAADCLLRAAKLLLRGARRSGEINPLLDIAYELHLVGAFRQSLEVIAPALKVAPASARGHHLKAHALSRLSQPDAARASAARAHALAPKASNAAILLATLETELGNAATARTLLESVAADPSDPNRARAVFELGRALDRLGQYEAAFERLVEAGALALRTEEVRKHDLGAVYRELEAEQELCTSEWFASRHPEVPAEGRTDPVFMIGFYRSGTTLLEQVLGAHPQIVTSDERDLVPRALRELARLAPGGSMHWTQGLEAIGGEGIRELRRRYWQQVDELIGGIEPGRIFIDKTALNTINIGFIHALFPAARILFVLRDPRDVCLSCFMQAFVPNALTSHFLDWEEGARFYAAVMTHWECMRSRLDLRCTVVRYEDLIRDLAGSLMPVLANLELEWDPAMLSFHERARTRAISTPSFADVTRPLYRSAEGRWRRYARYFDTTAQYLQPHVERHGYDRGE